MIWALIVGTVAPALCLRSVAQTAGERPPNDDFSAAFILDSQGSARLHGTTIGATREPDEPYNTNGVGSVWYKWTSSVSGPVQSKVNLGSPAFWIFGGSGNSVTNLARIDRGNGTPYLYAGVTYHIAAFGSSANAGEFEIDLEIQTAPPPNDNFADAVVLNTTPADVLVSGTTMNATVEQNEPFPNLSARSVWYRYTPQSSGRILLFTEEGSPIISLYSGNSLSDLKKMATLEVSSGQTYFIAVNTSGPHGDPFRFRINITTFRPINDHLADAVELKEMDGSVVISGTTSGATIETGEAHRSIDEGSVWFKWKPASSVTVQYVGLVGNSFFTLFEESSASPTGMRQLSMNGFYAVTAGVNYYVAVSAPSMNPGTFLHMLRIDTGPQRPVNDDFAQAFILEETEGKLIIAGTTLDSTNEPGEPGLGAGSVWYKWIALSFWDRNYSSQGAQNALSVYSGESIGTLTSASAIVPGHTYYFRVANMFFPGGPLPPNPGAPFKFTLPLAPSNDKFADAMEIPGPIGTVPVNLAGATVEPEEFVNCPGTAAATVWYKWTAPASGRFEAFITSTNDVRIDVLLGSMFGSPNVLVSGGLPNFADGQVIFEVIAGTTYYIRAVSCGSQSNRKMRYSFVPFDAVTPNDNFANAIRIEPSQNSLLGNNWGATLQSGEPALKNGASGKTVWYSWLAPDSGRFYVRVEEPNMRMAAFRGTLIDSLEATELYGTHNNVMFTAVPVTQGELIYVRVDSLNDGGLFTLDFSSEVHSPPPNDLFANATRLTGPALNVSGLIEFATAEPDEPMHRAAPYKSLWWRWDPAQSGTVRVDALSPSSNAVVSVYSGDQIENLQLLSSGVQSTTLSVTNGPTYYIAIAESPDGYGVFVVSTWLEIRDAGKNIPQFIDFPEISDLAFLPNFIRLRASSSSGLPVYFSIHSGPAQISLSDVLSWNEPGFVTVRADQTGNERFEPAPEVLRTILIRKATQSISFRPIRVESDPIVLDASSTSGLPVSFELADGIAQVIGNTLRDIGEGPITVKAVQAGDARHEAAEPVFQTVILKQLSQNIDLSVAPRVAPGPATGLRAFALASEFKLRGAASSLLPVSFAVVSGNATLAGDVLTIHGSGGAVVRAFQTGDLVFRPAAVEREVIVQGKSDQSIRFDALPNVPFGTATVTLNASASSGLPIRFEVVTGKATLLGDVLSISGPGSVTIRASQPGSDLFNEAPPLDRTFEVLKAPQNLDFPPLPNLPFGTTTVTLYASANSGLPVRFEVLAGKASVLGDVLSISGAGFVTVRALQSGSDLFNEALPIDRSFEVLRGRQTLDFPPLPELQFGRPPFALEGRASSGLLIGFEIVSGPIRINGNSLEILGAGPAVLKVTQAGNDDYLPAGSIIESFTIRKSPQTIQFEMPEHILFGSAPLELQATASSQLPVSLSILSGSAQLIDRSFQPLEIGEIVIHAAQPGNDDFEAAALDRKIAVIGQPHLSLKAEDGGITLSWPMQYAGFKLESANEIGGLWEEIILPLVTSGETIFAHIKPSNGSRYFRLRN